MSSFLKQSYDSDNETMYYQSPFKFPIPQSKHGVKHGVKHLSYDADTEDGDIILDEWIDYTNSYDDSQFFIFELDL